jgi:hypothetical protein
MRAWSGLVRTETHSIQRPFPTQYSNMGLHYMGMSGWTTVNFVTRSTCAVFVTIRVQMARHFSSTLKGMLVITGLFIDDDTTFVSKNTPLFFFVDKKRMCRSDSLGRWPGSNLDRTMWYIHGNYGEFVSCSRMTGLCCASKSARNAFFKIYVCLLWWITYFISYAI